MASMRARRLAIVAGALFAILALALFWPVGAGGLIAHPRPATSYEEAIARLDSLRALDTAAINPVCRTELMTHGHRTARVIVLLHGLTNCPRQFQLLGEQLYARGENVLIARLPRHGFADRLTPELASLTARELAMFTDQVMDIAHGLGDHVTLAGLSAGGVMAAWAAQNRSDLDRAVVIAPLLGLPGLPLRLNPVIANFWLLTPNRFYWWDAKLREGVGGPRNCYPRYGTRPLGELLRLGFAVSAQAAHTKPAARAIVLVTNASDRAIDNRAVAALAHEWSERGAKDVTSYEFPAHLELGHDLIDPEQPYQKVRIVYPVLTKLLDPAAEPHEKE